MSPNENHREETVLDSIERLLLSLGMDSERPFADTDSRQGSGDGVIRRLLFARNALRQRDGWRFAAQPRPAPVCAGVSIRCMAQRVESLPYPAYGGVCCTIFPHPTYGGACR